VVDTDMADMATVSL